MDSLSFHIAFLLTKHECVIVPGFGAFFAWENNTSERNSAGLFFPPSKTLTFSADINYDDGLLINSIAREQNLGQDDAIAITQGYVEEWRDTLQKGEMLQLPWVGKLKTAADGSNVFTPAPNLSCNAAVHGMAPVRMTTLNKLTAPAPKNISQRPKAPSAELYSVSKPVKKISKKPSVDKKIYIAVAAAAAVIAIIIIASLLYINNKSGSRKSFVKSESNRRENIAKPVPARNDTVKIQQKPAEPLPEKQQPADSPKDSVYLKTQDKKSDAVIDEPPVFMPRIAPTGKKQK